jgi:hypothetical protein
MDYDITAEYDIHIPTIEDLAPILLSVAPFDNPYSLIIFAH